MNEEYPTIYIVIPVHNRLDATRECLDSLGCQTYTHFKVVLVDDGSSDGTSDYVSKEHPQVVMLGGDGNLWWTGATNLGVGYALQYARENDYILTLNNDTVLPSTYLDTIVTLSREMPHALIGSIAVDYDQRDVVIDGGVRIHWFSAKYSKLKIPPGNGVASFYVVSVLSGRGTLIPAQVFYKIGQYDATKFPHYAADYDLSLRARKIGYISVLHPSCYLYSKAKLTGISNVHRKIGFGAWLGSFHSTRSPNNLKIRLRFGLRHAPLFYRPSFILCDMLRVTLGTFRNQIINLAR
jgi:GT2 family glycosyltransferase